VCFDLLLALVVLAMVFQSTGTSPRRVCGVIMNGTLTLKFKVALDDPPTQMNRWLSAL